MAKFRRRRYKSYPDIDQQTIYGSALEDIYEDREEYFRRRRYYNPAPYKDERVHKTLIDRHPLYSAYIKSKVISNIVTNGFPNPNLSLYRGYGLLKKARRSKKQCRKNKDARRHQFFKSIAKGGKSSYKPRRKHRC